MTLIDPKRPEGFFHLRLAPLRRRMLDEGASFFARAPDRGRASYFEPAPARPGCGPAPVSAEAAVADLLRLWRSEAQYARILGPLENDLAGLQAFVIAERNALRKDDGNEGKEVSDYVYPLS